MTNDLQQRRILGLAIALTSLGTMRVGVFPIDAPKPRPIDDALVQKLQQVGWRLQSTLPAQGRTQLTNAEGVVLTPPRSAGLDQARVTLMPIRARRVIQLAAESIERTIHDRSVSTETVQKGRSMILQSDQFFRFDANKQRQQASSCIASAQVSSTEEGMERAMASPPHSRLQRLQRFIGLEPLTDLSCLFVSISVPSSQVGDNQSTADSAIRQVWAKVGPLLKASYSKTQ